MASWAVLALFTSGFGVLYVPLHLSPAGIVLTCLYGSCTLVTIVSGTRSMRTDPSDADALARRKVLAADPSAPTPEPPAWVRAEGSVNFCPLCEAYVHKRSKHCRR